MSRPWMPLYVADYLADTAHLSAAEHGAYLLLIMHYWQKGGLPDDDKRLAAIARVGTRQWMMMRETIAAFFNGGWVHDRIDAELASAQAAYERRASAGSKGGKAKPTGKQSLSNAKAGLKQSHSQSEEAYASNSEPIGSGAGAPPVDLEKRLFERGKQVLGKSAGGVISRLKERCRHDVSEALSIVETAATKHNPMEWVQGVLRKPPDDDPLRNVDYAPMSAEELARARAMGQS